MNKQVTRRMLWLSHILRPFCSAFPDRLHQLLQHHLHCLHSMFRMRGRGNCRPFLGSHVPSPFTRETVRKVLSSLKFNCETLDESEKGEQRIEGDDSAKADKLQARVMEM